MKYLIDLKIRVNHWSSLVYWENEHGRNLEAKQELENAYPAKEDL
jgi:hypothetical protein